MARPRDPSIDRKIIDGCLQLMAEEGRVGLTRQRIAERAGVSLPAVIRRFDSVDDILIAIASTPYHDELELAGVETLRDYLVASLGRTVRTMHEDATLARSAVELLGAAAGHPVIASEMRASLARHRAQGLRLVAQAKTRGEIAPDVDGEVLLDLLNGAAYYRLLWRGEAPQETEVARIVDLLLDGARGAHPSPPKPARTRRAKSPADPSRTRTRPQRS